VLLPAPLPFVAGVSMSMLLSRPTRPPRCAPSSESFVPVSFLLLNRRPLPLSILYL
jgi:hypothetical protein